MGGGGDGVSTQPPSPPPLKLGVCNTKVKVNLKLNLIRMQICSIGNLLYITLILSLGGMVLYF